MDAEAGKRLTLNAAGTSDPDRQALSYRGFHYAEAGYLPGGALASVEISNERAARASVTVTRTCRPNWIPAASDTCAASSAHIILAVTDLGTPRLTSYRRVIRKVHAPATSR